MSDPYEAVLGMTLAGCHRFQSECRDARIIIGQAAFQQLIPCQGEITTAISQDSVYHTRNNNTIMNWDSAKTHLLIPPGEPYRLWDERQILITWTEFHFDFNNKAIIDRHPDEITFYEWLTEYEQTHTEDFGFLALSRYNDEDVVSIGAPYNYEIYTEVTLASECSDNNAIDSHMIKTNGDYPYGDYP